MILNTIATALLLISACLIAVLIIRKIPQLASIDAGAIPKERENQLKKQLIIDRMIRRIRLLFQDLGFLKDWFRTLGNSGKKLTERLKALERKLWLRRTQDLEAVLAAARLVQEKDPAASEELFLEVIKHHHHHIEAYEGLAEIYMTRKEWNNAQSTLQFLRKINPKRERHYLYDLAKTSVELGDPKHGLAYAEQLVSLTPSEPRFLDLFVEIAILGGDRGRAKEGLERLVAVNPENAKIPEFKEKLKSL